MSEPLARVEVQKEGDAVRVTIRGEIDLSNAEDLERELSGAVASAAAVTIDLEHVDYMDSRGVRLLYHVAKQLRPGSALAVVAPEGTFASTLLRLTGFQGSDGGKG